MMLLVVVPWREKGWRWIFVSSCSVDRDAAQKEWTPTKKGEDEVQVGDGFFFLASQITAVAARWRRGAPKKVL